MNCLSNAFTHGEILKTYHSFFHGFYKANTYLIRIARERLRNQRARCQERKAAAEAAVADATGDVGDKANDDDLVMDENGHILLDGSPSDPDGAPPARNVRRHMAGSTDTSRPWPRSSSSRHQAQSV